MKKIKENNLHFAFVFFLLIFILGIFADINLYKFKFLGETQANYEFGSTEGNIQTEYVVNFPFKVTMVDLNGLTKNIFGQHEMNGVIKLNNGYLTAISKYINTNNINRNAQAIIDYNEYCKKKGIIVLFAQPAYKISKWDDELPLGVSDTHNEITDRLLQKLNDGGVNTLDLRQCMHDDGINQYDMYYKTDHHWTTEGGFYAYQKVSQWISEKTGCYLDESLLNLDNYQIDTYKKWHLGMHGQRTGALFAGIDDYDLIYPKFDTHILNSYDETVYSLKDSLINMDVFQKKNSQSRYTYDWAYEKNNINYLSSQDAKSDLSVFLFSDSFQQAFKPYMLLTYKHFNVSGYGTLTTSMLEEYQPEVVVIMAWPGYYTDNAQTFTFVDDFNE